MRNGPTEPGVWLGEEGSNLRHRHRKPTGFCQLDLSPKVARWPWRCPVRAGLSLPAREIGLEKGFSGGVPCLRQLIGGIRHPALVGHGACTTGEGTRMRSDRPKPLHLLCGKAMLVYVLDSLLDCSMRRAVVVVGHGAEHVTKKLQEHRTRPGARLRRAAPVTRHRRRRQRRADRLPRRRGRPGRRRRAGAAGRHAAAPGGHHRRPGRAPPARSTPRAPS